MVLGYKNRAAMFFLKLIYLPFIYLYIRFIHRLSVSYSLHPGELFTGLLMDPLQAWIVQVKNIVPEVSFNYFLFIF